MYYGACVVDGFFMCGKMFFCGIGMVFIETVCALRFPMNWMKKITFIDYGRKSGFFRSEKIIIKKLI